MRARFLTLLFSAFLIALPAVSQPKMLAYSASPNGYLNEHAAEVARCYDGFLFVVGDWDEAVAGNLGFGADAPASSDWLAKVAENVKNLNAAGATESVLDVHFAENGVWPSPETLRSADYTAKMARHFGRVAQAAKENGFRGVAIDVEYPYRRYALDHEIYTWDGYTVEDILNAAETQGRATMSAVLDAYPEAVVFVLPGEPRNRPVCREYMKGLLAVMAGRNAPGGYHLAYERAYCLWDGPVSQIALCRDGDLAIEWIWKGNDAVLRYWKDRCSVAPGVWPLHMIETGGKDYPVRPWPEELAELRAQLQALRTVAKRYVWSYSGAPVWCPADPSLKDKYGVAPASFEGAADVVRQWQDIVADKTAGVDPRAERLVRAVKDYDQGRLSAPDLCGTFGSPADWYVLGLLGNPFTKPQFAAPGAVTAPIRPDAAVQGRTDAVHWFPFQARAPLGSVSMTGAFDWRNTNDQSAHLAAELHSPRAQNAFLNIGWDDGIRVWLGDKCVFDRAEYPQNGHGAQFRDRYLFEERAEITLPAGATRLGVTSINSHGSWTFNLRITDVDGFPIEGVTFGLPKTD